MPKTYSGRINIYVDDPVLRKHVRLAAVLEGTSISEYCVTAIREKLERDEKRSTGNAAMSRAVRNAQEFQANLFGKKAFSVTSAQLINEARKSRADK